MNRITPQGKKLLKWLRHWKIASAVADGRAEAAPGQLSDEALAFEAHALKIMANMIRGKYLTADARRVRARWKRGR